MKLAILETGKPPQPLIARFGRYPEMFRSLLGDGFDYASYDVASGELPAGPHGHDAFLITGSPAGVYDPLPWIGELVTFLKAMDRDTKLVGICFGHQVMAEAYGGHVEKVGRGWGVGLQSYSVMGRTSWMADETKVSVPASHQDQIVIQPPRTEIIASSGFTPYAGLAWRDRNAISFQFHPEFSPGFTAALIDARRDQLPDAEAAIASLDQPNDNARVGAWIRRFLKGA